MYWVFNEDTLLAACDAYIDSHPEDQRDQARQFVAQANHFLHSESAIDAGLTHGAVEPEKTHADQS